MKPDTNYCFKLTPFPFLGNKQVFRLYGTNEDARSIAEDLKDVYHVDFFSIYKQEVLNNEYLALDEIDNIYKIMREQNDYDTTEIYEK